MARQLNRVLSGIVETRRSRSLRNRLAMTTILAVVPFLGYGRQVYAACDPSPSPIFVCSDISPAQNINYDDADVSTVPGFSIPAGVGNAMSITGDGHLQFTDNNASTITGTGTGLYVYSTGDSAGNDGAVTINANSNITGGYGIKAYNQGAGSIDITFDGTATGTTDRGIEVNNSSNGEDLTITTGAQSTVSGNTDGITASNNGSGDLSITANGDVYGFNHDGIYAYNSGNGGDLTIKQGETSFIGAFHVGIGATNRGDGDLSITANGVVQTSSGSGIFAYNSGDGDNLDIKTGLNSNIDGDYHGIDAENQGDGDLTITANGRVDGDGGNGIHTFNQGNGDNLTIETGASSAIYGDNNGIYARNYGDEDLKVTANGLVTGQNNNGIDVINQGNGEDLTVETGASSYVYGFQNGIRAINRGDGNLNVTAKGIVVGENEDGVYAYNSADGHNLTVISEATSDVTGYTNGMFALNFGNGDLEVTADGKVTGENADGIRAVNVWGTLKTPGYDYIGGDGHDLTVTTGVASNVTGANYGINAINSGDGDLVITANGRVTGEDGDGIHAVNIGRNNRFVDGYTFYNGDGHDLTITTGAASVVRGEDDGINAANYGDGDLTITVKGSSIGTEDDGVDAENSRDGVDLTITTEAGSIVVGQGDDGIDAEQEGSGDLDVTVRGAVTGQDGNGIEADNYGGSGKTDIKVEGNGLVQGTEAGIDAESHNGQDIDITNDGTVRNLSGESFDRAIYAHGGAADITTNGVLIGTVTTDLGNNFDDNVDNGGYWSMTGQSRFGGGNDEVNNTGTLQAANDPTSSQAARFFDLNEFNNDGGLISMVDGGAGDSLQMSGDTPGGLQYKSTNGRLAVDAALGPGLDGVSDDLLFDGSIDGKTLVHVNVVAATGANTEGIPVVRVVNGTTDEGDFDLDGPLNAGFFTWDLRKDDGGQEWHELFTSGVGVGSYEFAAGISGGQEVWHQTTGTLLQRQADLRSLLNGTGVTPVADFGEPVAPTPTAHITPGFWLRGLGAYIERDDEENGFTLDRKQTIWGGMAGFDFGTEGAGDVWMFGLFGGYITSDLDFTETNSEWTFEGPTVGAYVTYLEQGLHADLTVKADFLDVNIDPDDLAPTSDDEDTDALNLGARLDAGYKIGDTLFIEPQATLAVLHTEIDDVDIFGGTVEFDDQTSFRGRLGLRVGFDHTDSTGTVYSADVTGSAWEDFSDDNEVTIANSGLPNFSVSDDPGQTIGDVSLGLSAASPEGWSGFLRGNYLFGTDYEAVTGNAGVRWAW